MTSGTQTVQTVQAVFLLLLVFVALFTGLARRLKIAYPIVLVIAGLLVSFIPGMPRIPLNPDLVFLVFLPPLLYSAAWTLSWREFQRNFVSIAMLAIGLVTFTVLGLAKASVWFLPGFDWRSGFLLGAVVAATDPIAATSIARRMGMSQRIVDILEAESLINDGTGLLAFQFGLMILMQGYTPTVIGGVGRLIYLMGAGVLIGLLIGIVVAWFDRWVNDGPIEIVISILVPFGAYLAGNAIHASGVLAVIACGMYMSRRSSDIFQPGVRLQHEAVWEALTFILNGIVFVLIGLQLPYVMDEIRGIGRLTLIEYATAFSLLMILVRMLWVFAETYGTYTIRQWLKTPENAKPEARSVFVIGWGGMRGVLSLAAALTLPYTLPGGHRFQQRSLIVFLTFSLILATLVIQGLPLPWLIKKLGLARSQHENFEETEARRMLLREALNFLQRSPQDSEADREDIPAPILQDLARHYQQRLDALPIQKHQPAPGYWDNRKQNQMLVEVIGVERAILARLRNEGKIDDDVMRTLQRELDLTESRLHTGSH